MTNEPQSLTVSVNADDTVTALLYLASKQTRSGVTLLLGHGAGANQLSGFMRLFASGLATGGIDVMTFNFIYMEHGRGAPDKKAKLELCFRAVIDVALRQRKLKDNRLFIGGKSMGGRIASQVAAEASEHKEELAGAISGLVLLGYPLHPPGNPDKLRVDHLNSIRMPMLFVQGTRDSLGTPDEIRPFLKNLRPPAQLFAIEGGDHSFKAPKKFGLTQEQVYEAAMNEIVRWIGAL